VALTRGTTASIPCGCRPGDPNTMRRNTSLRPLRPLLVILAIGVLVGFFAARPPERDEPVSIVPLLASIQNMGQLHAVRYNMHDVVEHERKLEPTGVFRSLPGAAEIYGAATRNKVLVKAEGGVEAGIDLSKVGPDSVSRVTTPEGVKYRVRLPRAELYTPEVRVSVVRHTNGIFWKDANIVPEATRMVQKRFTDAARQSDILQKAETNAVATLVRVVELNGGGGVEFYF
jgi:hypothetical protein